MTVQTNVPSRWAAGLAFLNRYGFRRVECEITMRSDKPLPAVTAPAGIKLISQAAFDVEAVCIAELHNAAFRDDAGLARQAPDDARRHLDGGRLWTARLAGEVVGYALVESKAGSSWLETVEVDPACRARGIGAALIGTLLGDAVGQAARRG